MTSSRFINGWNEFLTKKFFTCDIPGAGVNRALRPEQPEGNTAVRRCGVVLL
jgi:hypothetical protein